MNVVVTGDSSGIGVHVSRLFLKRGHTVFGLDKKESAIQPFEEGAKNYNHFVCDIVDVASLPKIECVEILVNNAGIQSALDDDIRVNLLGSMRVTEKYAFQSSIKSVLFNASVSALSGNEFATYAASKAGVVGYMKHCAIRLANEFKATCNALCFGGVATKSNRSVMENPALWKKIMDVTPLKRWMSEDEAAEWIYFLTVVNSFCTGQAIDVSGGERNCADLFVWN